MGATAPHVKWGAGRRLCIHVYIGADGVGGIFSPSPLGGRMGPVPLARIGGAGAHPPRPSPTKGGGRCFPGWGCGFREIGAAISRDRGRLFHGIAGSHFAVAGRLVDGFMESGLMAEVKGFRVFAAHAFA